MLETYMLLMMILVLLWDETSISGLVLCYAEAQLITFVHP